MGLRVGVQTGVINHLSVVGMVGEVISADGMAGLV
jgi:hypothetical protein